MPHVTVGRENSGEIRIYYEDHGIGLPVVLISGYLADAHAWEKQEPALLNAGYRVISYDRRGSGRSSRPAGGYGYDTLAADLGVLLEALEVQDAVLVGSCSGTGEVIRYLANNACQEDFRADLGRIFIPVLVVQGSQDRIMPPTAAGHLLAAALANARFVEITGGPHAITWTHAPEVNQALLGFLRGLGRG